MHCSSFHATLSKHVPVVSSWTRARPNLSAPSSTSTAEVIVAGHPDAVRRRLEAEQRRKERDSERANELAREKAGIAWYEGERPSNMHLASSLEQLQELMKQADDNDSLLVMDFFTNECYVCKSMYPKLKKIAAENLDVTFVKINGFDDAVKPFFELSGVSKVPFFHLYRRQAVVSRFAASLLPEKLAQLRGEIRKHKM